jgi:hypothetical protein
MIALVAAELLKLIRQRGACFWGFLALPAFLTLVAFALESVAPLARGFAMTDAAPATPANLALAWLVSWLELVALGGTVALLAVATRSALGVILPTFLLALASATLEALLNLQGDNLAMLPLPNLAADALRGWIPGGTSAAAAAIAAAALLAWSALTYGAALFLFARQDLASE